MCLCNSNFSNPTEADLREIARLQWAIELHEKEIERLQKENSYLNRALGRYAENP